MAARFARQNWDTSWCHWKDQSVCVAATAASRPTHRVSPCREKPRDSMTVRQSTVGLKHAHQLRPLYCKMLQLFNYLFFSWQWTSKTGLNSCKTSVNSDVNPHNCLYLSELVFLSSSSLIFLHQPLSVHSLKTKRTQPWYDRIITLNASQQRGIKEATPTNIFL